MTSTAAKSSDSGVRARMLQDRFGVTAVARRPELELDATNEAMQFLKLLGKSPERAEELKAELLRAFAEEAELPCGQKIWSVLADCGLDAQHFDGDTTAQLLAVPTADGREVWLGMEVMAEQTALRCKMVDNQSRMDFCVLVHLEGMHERLITANCELKVNKTLQLPDFSRYDRDDAAAQAAVFTCGLVLPSVVDVCGSALPVVGAAVATRRSSATAVLLEPQLPPPGGPWTITGRFVTCPKGEDTKAPAMAALLHVLRRGINLALRLPLPGSQAPEACMLGRLPLSPLQLLATPCVSRLGRDGARASQALILHGEMTKRDMFKWLGVDTEVGRIEYAAPEWDDGSAVELVVKVAGSAYPNRTPPHVVQNAYRRLGLCEPFPHPVLLVAAVRKRMLVTVMRRVRGRAADESALLARGALEHLVDILDQLGQRNLVHVDIRLANIWVTSVAGKAEELQLLDWDSLADCVEAPSREDMRGEGAALRALRENVMGCLEWAIWQLALLFWHEKSNVMDKERARLLRGLYLRGGLDLFQAALQLELLRKQTVISDWAQLRSAVGGLRLAATPIEQDVWTTLRQECQDTEQCGWEDAENQALDQAGDKWTGR